MTDFKVGDYVTHTMWTDTTVYVVAKRTEKTLTLRHASDGPDSESVHIDGNVYPVTYTSQTDDAWSPLTMCRAHADGSFHPHGGKAIRICPERKFDSGVFPYRVTDYRV